MVKGKRVLQHLCLYPGVLGLARKNMNGGSQSDSPVDIYEVNFDTVVLLQSVRCVFDGVYGKRKSVFSHFVLTLHDGHLTSTVLIRQLFQC